MENKTILKTVDHTLLKQTSTWEDIKTICDDAVKYEVASVCIPPSFVKKAKEYVGDKMQVCTVIGFPNGYNTTDVKVYETKDAISKGADEIDMVINLGMVKENRFEEIEDEIKAIKEACGEKILKVIIETCLLTEEEKIAMCKCVTNANADYIKTSTGFSSGGAAAEDLKLFADNVGKDVLIKAAGGISDLETASQFIEIGAKRLGTSRIIKLINNEECSGY
ncbi:deoxyribose-phosphate aldolase [Terrisporobacter mayombei]|uniref:Deoxyribose-phosphate aldolase n=1 Tax=Terrisporobacter mayombei TaxID=1541 RepID=A0ABY9PVP5_9FIRM|nr:deoxyribose-phosphate aldolase [Terrisporobacter mayombei]MCC3869858.1 deoxyribose-phosphate aldolase [Terrisporobacter mayombei]WMT79747.1 Deoxyribose-phosphate aldolase [Terrisporobacter mayombei]